jgi:hypothetical protein
MLKYPESNNEIIAMETELLKHGSLKSIDYCTEDCRISKTSSIYVFFATVKKLDIRLFNSEHFHRTERPTLP